ncbi:PKD domain-containing protein, partial [Bacteroidetes/Chlorobi group bacterium ChocPot_Mid]
MLKILIYTCSILFLVANANGQRGWYELNSNTDKFLYDVCFVDSLNGWVVGDLGLVLRTTDGGKNWVEQDVNVGSWLLCVSFIDKLTGWVAGDIGRIRKTTNAGGSWSNQDPDFYLESINSIHFVDKNNGWAVGPAGIIHTKDGGENWYVQDSANFNINKSIFFINEFVGWACGSDGEIVRTFDGGITWTKLKIDNPGMFYDIFFIDLSNGWVVSRYEPKIQRTTNGGNTWSEQQYPIDGFFKTIQFVDKNNGWAVGPGGIIKSTDGGQNWKTQVPESRYNLWGASFVNKDVGYAVGGNGKILKTTTGGVKFNVDFMANIVEGEAPLSVTFTDLTLGDHTKWLWDFGDGGQHTTKNPVYIYQKPGIYNVTLTVSDSLDSDKLTKSKYIIVTAKDPLIADFTADTTEGEAPLLVKFTDLSQGYPDSWEWDFGNGATHRTQNPINVYQSSGTFTVRLTVKRGLDSSSIIKQDFIKVKDPIGVKETYNKLIVFEPTP